MLMRESLHQGSLEHQCRHTALVLLTGHRSRELLQGRENNWKDQYHRNAGEKITRFVKALNLATVKHMPPILGTTVGFSQCF